MGGPGGPMGAHVPSERLMALCLAVPRRHGPPWGAPWGPWGSMEAQAQQQQKNKAGGLWTSSFAEVLWTSSFVSWGRLGATLGASWG